MKLFTGFDLETPALIIEKSIMERNLAKMQYLADDARVKLRPHTKTHKSARLAKRQLELGAIGIAVAKLSEAEVMAAAGIDDIQIANIIVGEKKVKRLLSLSDRIKSITSAVDNSEQALPLGNAFADRGKKAKLFIEVDTGLHRSGVMTKEQALELAVMIHSHPGLEFAGLLTHAGSAYSAKSIEEIRQIGINEGMFLKEIAELLKQNGIVVPCLSAGSTPTAQYCSRMGITELRPGNYIYNDMIQCSLGVAKPEEVALSILATVIGTPAGNRVVIDAGSKSLSLDRGAHANASIAGYGHIVGKNALIVRVSEEHGVIIHQNEKFKIGEQLRILPNHACAVSNLFNKAYIADDDLILEEISIDARGCVW